MQMSLGNCCDGEPPSSSLSSSSVSSVSGPSEVSQVAATCGTPNCIDGVMARRYKFAFNWSPPLGTHTCVPKYNTEHTLGFVESGSHSGRCYFETATRAGRSLIDGAGCSDCPGQPLAQFVMANSGFYSMVGTYRYSLIITACRYQDHPSLPYTVSLLYGDNLGNSSAGAFPAEKPDCLGSLTLPLRMSLPAPAFGTIFRFNRYANFIVPDVDHVNPPLSVTLSPA